MKYWDDPDSLAQDCVRSTLAGDTSGIDNLIGAYRTFQGGVARLNAPQACKEHQRLSTEVMGHGIDMLTSMKAAIETGDVSALTSVQGDAAALEERGREADLLAEQIKARYGIE